MSKKDGGTIKNWQMHVLYEDDKSVEMLKNTHPNAGVDKIMMFTGIVLEDPTGRWLPGYHMRSTVILNYDEETGEVETLNTMYKLLGEGGNDVVPDLGKRVTNIFY